LAGHYAVVFGSNRFGATGLGNMPTNNFDLFGLTPYFFWDPVAAQWRNTTDGGLRFVVTGRAIEAIPEPSTMTLFVAGLLAFRPWRYTRRLRAQRGHARDTYGSFNNE
jgi:hypothetical protein